MNQQELEKLSNKEISQLWEKNRNEQRKQQGLREAQARANADLGVDDEAPYWIDGFGNRIEGRRPAPKSGGYYIDSAGYARELSPGEQPPEPGSGDGLRDWLKTVDVANDPEVRAALGEQNLFFEEEIQIGDSEVLLVGRLTSAGWDVTSRSENRKVDFKFRLPRNISCAEAVAQSVGYVETKAGPQFRNLTDNERRMCERMAVNNRLNALGFYVQCRLPEDLAERFLQLGATGDELAILNFAADEEISGIVEEAVANVYYFNNIRADGIFLIGCASMMTIERGPWQC